MNFDGIVHSSNELIVTSSITVSQVGSVVETCKNKISKHTCYSTRTMAKIANTLTWVLLKVGFLESFLRLASSKCPCHSREGLFEAKKPLGNVAVNLIPLW